MSQPALSRDAIGGCKILVQTCAALLVDERVTVVSDPDTVEIGEGIASAASEVAEDVTHRTIDALLVHGQEPPADVAAQMARSHVIFGVTRLSMAHTQARLSASEEGARYLSLPDYSEAVLESQALRADFRGLTVEAESVAGALSNATEIVLYTGEGQRLVCSSEGRQGNSAPGWCPSPGSLASPPDSEANVAVVEDRSEGVFVVNGSIPCPELGLLQAEIELFVRDGLVTDIRGERSEALRSLLFGQSSSKARIIAEFGIGLNPSASLCGVMLEDEGCRGTVHLGVGGNATVGGKNEVAFHLDHVVGDATVEIDGQVIVENGTLKGI
ncbi:MAG: hypothetical protein CME26_03145 [Gemmatimonadetes bacterium]|nr:hypothetical protein [Gemmatimonadota bacterium]